MQPDQPAPQNSGQYDFILNHGTPPERPKKLGLPSPNSSMQRIVIVVVGVFLLVTVGLVLFSVLTGGGGTSETQLLEVAQQQTELVRVADQASSKARSTNTLNFAANVSLTISTTHQSMSGILTREGIKSNDKRLAFKKNVQTDQLLLNAAQNGQFDETLTKTLQTQLLAYQASLSVVYKGSKNPKDKAILQEAYKGVGILLGDQSKTQ